MKKTIAIVLICCYSMALLKPLFPLVADFMAHTFWEPEHMATVHYENGQYHVHVEMKNAGDKQDSPVQPGSSKKGADEVNIFHLQAEKTNCALTPLTSSTPLSFKENKFPSAADLSVASPPPWFC